MTFRLADEDGGLSCLVPVLQETYTLVTQVFKPVEKSTGKFGYINFYSIWINNFSYYLNIAEQNLEHQSLSIEKIYSDLLKEMQFGKFFFLI